MLMPPDSGRRAGRPWGFWTRGKLDILRRYLEAFTTASKSADERVYIDAFAGEPHNFDRLTGEDIEGSARIALTIDDPPLTRLRFFEKEHIAIRLEEVLRRDFANRDFKVIAGDCNETIPLELRKLRRFGWAPTFAFLDQNTLEAEWRTIETLADFKAGRPYKVELFLLFSPSMFVRLLPTQGRSVSERDAERITKMYGTDQWRHIYVSRLQDELTPEQAQFEYLNLMRWRLENELGYQRTHALAIGNERGRVIYHMVFATDHPAGDRIMRYLYRMAAEEFPKMREEARRSRQIKEEEQSGIQRLFSDEDLQSISKEGEHSYEHEPPTRPWFFRD